MSGAPFGEALDRGRVQHVVEQGLEEGARAPTRARGSAGTGRRGSAAGRRALGSSGRPPSLRHGRASVGLETRKRRTLSEAEETGDRQQPASMAGTLTSAAAPPGEQAAQDAPQARPGPDRAHRPLGRVGVEALVDERPERRDEHGARAPRGGGRRATAAARGRPKARPHSARKRRGAGAERGPGSRRRGRGRAMPREKARTRDERDDGRGRPSSGAATRRRSSRGRARPASPWPPPAAPTRSAAATTADGRPGDRSVRGSCERLWYAPRRERAPRYDEPWVRPDPAERRRRGGSALRLDREPGRRRTPAARRSDTGLHARHDARRPLPHRRPARQGRHGRGLPRRRHQARPARRPEVPARRRSRPSCSSGSTPRCASAARSRTPTSAASTTSSRSTATTSSPWSTWTARTWPRCWRASAACPPTRRSTSRATSARDSRRCTTRASSTAT